MMPRLGRRQLHLLRLCQRFGNIFNRSGDLTESMLWGESETKVSEMLTRLEALGLVDGKNTLTDIGRTTLECE